MFTRRIAHSALAVLVAVTVAATFAASKPAAAQSSDRIQSVVWNDAVNYSVGMALARFW